MTVPQIRHTPLALKAARTTALQTAADLIGQSALASGMGIADRTLRSYMSVERSMPGHAMTAAANALEAQALALVAHAARMRELAQ